ncbi:MAG: hypothetical protein DRJ05_16000 [Bacteroidetes bacterium]|nr:MAG: hypothetical protein DRJ05_16000 [Bacteroidota bacterium]
MYACQEDEIQLEPGIVSVQNNSTTPLDIYHKNIDLGDIDYTSAGTVLANSSLDIALSVGYNYQFKAIEFNPEKSEESFIVETILVKPHNETVWLIPQP